VAVRIELFTIAGLTDFEIVDPADLDQAVAVFDAEPTTAPDGLIRCVGWLSADDDDEERFSGWCERVDNELGLGLLVQGIGESEGLDARGVPPMDEEPERSWADTLRTALELSRGARLGWRTNFDLSGTVGTSDDYPTAHHRDQRGDGVPPAR
jgi:hypothetical protein